MKWYSATKRGEQHTVHCEDAALVNEIGKNRWMAAVIDGDSEGRESHFASTLFAKILRRMGNEFQYFEEAERRQKPLKDLQELALLQLMEELNAFKDLLFLEDEELMSTLILLLLDTKAKQAEIIVIGQGLISVDDKLHCYRSDEKPDYLVYHIDEDFYEWYHKQENRLSLTDFSDITIATDGFFSFNNSEKASVCKDSFLQEFLFSNKDGNEETNMMEKKLEALEKEHRVFPKDDIALVRILT